MYTLIFTAMINVYGQAQGLHTHSEHDYSSQASCETARQTVIKQIEKFSNSMDYNAVCIKN
jgi:hypothetical protein